ncbi:MAG TPA: hypothetical protein VGR73_09045 [Bryobacteraceae bacterium]|nr:hypothetical protein [Bryobacteraceae bacterium]
MRRLLRTTSQRLAAGGELAIRFWTNEQAQDITEYTLLLSFVVIVTAALLVINGSSISGIWGDAQGILGVAYVQANGS